MKVQNDYGDNARIVVSCSFGIDSIVTLHLVKKVAEKLGIAFDVVWNNTLNEYPQTRKYARELSEAWGLNTIEARPLTTLTKVYEENGVDSLFKRKGDRSDGKPVIEKCCHHLKHQPMRKAIREHGWHLMFNGVRAGESRQRWMSARRDGEIYYSRSEWKTWVARPILWWTSLTDSFNYGNNRQEDVWDYVKKFAIPYNPIYDMNAVIDDKYSGNALVVDRETAQELAAQGYNVFMPRTGCQACPIPIKRGYLRYLRQVFPRVFRAMLFQLGFARVLLAEMDEDEREALIREMSAFGVVDEPTQDAIIERLEMVLKLRPCAFDSVGTGHRKKRKKLSEEEKQKVAELAEKSHRDALEAESIHYGRKVIR
ncbi:phosphoadenosine phosphosulfate reductase family protein [Brevibacillus agri]|uniref:phosphoadenosine phosphosulfate reductase domain-containing protein n=1 Tax=Brevibacillus agri TaxID=51101 RepID=UPI0012DD1080|nr:phosphoadenosine phosphosulfate reductase family protein [Brevibacillus agri]